MDTGKLTELLHDLASINLERAKAYETASLQNQLFDVELRTTFALLANQSRQNNNTLNLQVEKLLAKTPGPRPVHGLLYDQWKSNSTHYTGGNRNDLLASCETGEQAMITMYEKALENQLRTEVREMLENQLRSLQSSQATIKKAIESGNAPTYPRRY
jgi:uncharacterized protein (TIGR02284 family)